jgi:hypothetical protein
MSTWQLGLGLALALAAASGAQRAEAAAGGYVHSLTGSATLQAADAASRPLKVGDLVQSGDIVMAGGEGSVVIQMEDGQVMLLGAASSFRVTEYHYDKANMGESRVVFGLLKGRLRFITGLLGATHREIIKVAAGGATVGIHGTDVTATYDPARATVGMRGTDVTLIYDPAAQTATAIVNAGAAQLSAFGGSRNIEAGAFSVATRNAMPSLPQALRAAPSWVQQAADAMLKMGNISVNTPVSVETSARAAAAHASASEVQAKAAANPEDTALQEQAAQAQQQAKQAAAAAAAAAQQALQSVLTAAGVKPAPDAPAR